MANELTITNRKDYTNAIKLFDSDTRKAIDEALALGNDFGRAHNEEAKRVNVARAIAVYRIAADKEAVEKAGYKTFKEIAFDLFGLNPANATNYRKAAEQFYCNDDAPVCKDWWGPSTLYLFCAAKVDNETIKAAIEAGKLAADSTNEAIKAWITSLEVEALEDGKPEIAKLYDADICVYTPAGMTTNTLYGVTVDEVRNALIPEEGAVYDNTYFSTFDPHSTITRVNRKGASKEVKGKGLVFICLTTVAKAVYYPAEVKKTSGPSAETVKAQNATIEKMRAAMRAAGLDPDAI